MKTIKEKTYIIDDAIKIDPTGNYIVSTSYKEIKVWDSRSAKLLNILKGHSNNVNSVAIDPTGQFVVSGGEDETIKIWNLKSGKFLKELKGHASYIYSVAIDPTGQYIVSGSSKTIKIWSLKSGSLLKSIKGGARTIAVDQKGKFIVSGYGGQIKVWNFGSGKLLKTLAGHSSHFNTLVIDPQFIVSGDSDHSIRIRDSKSGKLLKTLKGHTDDLNSVTIDPSGEFIVSGSDDNIIKIWDLKTGKLLKTLKGHTSAVNSVTIDPSGEFIVSGSDDNTIKIWNLKSGRLLKTLKGHSWHASAVAIDPTGKFIVSGWRSKIKIWNLKSGELLKTLEGHSSLFSIAIDPTGQYIISGGWEHIKIWGLQSGKLLRTIKGHSSSINALAVDPTGQFIVSGSQDTTIKIWHLKNLELFGTINGHSSDVQALAVDPTGQFIVSGSQDTTIKIWYLKKRKLLTTLYSFENSSIAITPEGYFAGTGKYGDYIHFIDDKLNVHTFDQFSRRFFRPEMVELALSGKELMNLETIDTVVSHNPAPLVTIISPNNNFITTSDIIEVKVETKDNGGGIGDIYLYVNDSIVSTDKRAIKIKPKGNTKIMSFNVALSRGENRVKVVAYNYDNSMGSTPDFIKVTSDYKFGIPNLYALVTGIDIYENNELNLRYAVADAKLFSKTLKQLSSHLFNDVKITFLSRPKETTKDAITKAFEKISHHMKAEDYFIFYGASHGYIATFNNADSKYFMIPSNVIFLDPVNLKKDAISQDELVNLVGNIPAQNKIIVLDTCHSGEAGRVVVQIAMAKMQATYTRALSTATAMELLRIASGSSVFTASQSAEQAIEGYNGHGLFTYTIVEGLRGKANENGDEFITLNELKGYVEREVFIRSKKNFKRKQIPYINIGTLDWAIVKIR